MRKITEVFFFPRCAHCGRRCIWNAMQFAEYEKEHLLRRDYVHWRCGLPFITSAKGKGWLSLVADMMAKGATVTDVNTGYRAS